MDKNKMNKLSTNTTRRAIAVAFGLVACLLLTVTNAKAHGDLIHVIGFVTKVSDNSVSVKTKDGTVVDVLFGQETTYFRAKTATIKGDIKVGDRVVIHAAKVKDHLTAHTVELGPATALQKGTEAK